MNKDAAAEVTAPQPKLDLGFKEGQTITINIGVRCLLDYLYMCIVCYLFRINRHHHVHDRQQRHLAVLYHSCHHRRLQVAAVERLVLNEQWL
jgi:hypothetical protein